MVTQKATTHCLFLYKPPGIRNSWKDKDTPAWKQAIEGWYNTLMRGQEKMNSKHILTKKHAFALLMLAAGCASFGGTQGKSWH